MSSHFTRNKHKDHRPLHPGCQTRPSSSILLLYSCPAWPACTSKPRKHLETKASKRRGPAETFRQRGPPCFSCAPLTLLFLVLPRRPRGFGGVSHLAVFYSQGGCRSRPEPSRPLGVDREQHNIPKIPHHRSAVHCIALPLVAVE